MAAAAERERIRRYAGGSLEGQRSLREEESFGDIGGERGWKPRDEEVLVAVGSSKLECVGF